MTTRPIASLSLDADDCWAYLRTHGDAAWTSHPTYLARVLPLALDVFDELRLAITFFIVGFDATRAENGAALAALAARGHEVGNHSFWHEIWLPQYARAQIDEELARAEQAIEHATGVRPTGFRGPGFGWSAALLDVLAARGYAYDASTLPTILAPLARRYFLATATLSDEERRRRAALFGTLRDGFRPIAPYRWRLADGRTILEIPVTTMPVLRIPFHLSYLIYLARISRAAMMAYLHFAMLACRALGVAPSFLMHPLDFIGGDEVPVLGFFPGMDLPTSRKVALTKDVLRTLGRYFELVPMGVHAARVLARGTTGERRVPILVGAEGA